MICDEAVKDCIVKACCTEVCWKVRNLMEGNQRIVKNAKAYAYGNMRKNEYCPVCHTHYFTYQLGPAPLGEDLVDKIYLVCAHCWAGINLDRYINDWRIIYAHFPKLSKMEPRSIGPIKKLEDIFKLVETRNNEVVLLRNDKGIPHNYQR